MSTEFKHILVPLDGSRLAEAALPAALFFAASLHARLTLLHVLERHAPSTVHGEPHLKRAAEAEAYLDRVVERCRAAGVTADAHVHSAPAEEVAAGIAAHAAELGADLIALCTHGSGGVRDLLIGSIAQQTLRLGTTSVLLVRPTPSGAAPGFGCGEVVVALDPVAHGVLPLDPALPLARACGAHLHLVSVVPTPATLPAQRRATATFSPGAMKAVLDLERRDLQQLLDDTAQRLRAQGLTTTSAVREGDPVPEVLRALGETHADLLVLATHGRAGLGGLLAGSFARRIVPQSPVPVLLVRITGSAPRPQPGR